MVVLWYDREERSEREEGEVFVIDRRSWRGITVKWESASLAPPSLMTLQCWEGA